VFKKIIVAPSGNMAVREYVELRLNVQIGPSLVVTPAVSYSINIDVAFRVLITNSSLRNSYVSGELSWSTIIMFCIEEESSGIDTAGVFKFIVNSCVTFTRPSR